MGSDICLFFTGKQEFGAAVNGICIGSNFSAGNGFGKSVGRVIGFNM